MMREFRLGIVGRCLALQPFIKLSAIYHKRLKVLFEERERICLKVALAKNANEEPLKRTEDLLDKRRIDGVLFHLNKFCVEEPLLLRKNDIPNTLRYRLNPLLKKEILFDYREYDVIADCIKYRRKIDSIDLHDLPPKSSLEWKHTSVWKRFFYKGRRQTNLWLGRLFGLNRLAIEFEWYFFKKVQKFCWEKKVPLFVLGGIPVLDVFECKKKNE